MARLGAKAAWAAVLAAGVFVFGSGGSAAAQSCPGFQIGEGFPGLGPTGSGASTYAGASSSMVSWDPDGNGPLPEMLVVGGAFSSVDGVPASCVAAWDGRQWHALGSGMRIPASGGPLAVTCLAVLNGELYAGGRFGITPTDSVTTYRVAKWDGASWVQVGPTLNGPVNVMTSFAGELYIGGRFVIPGGANIAKLSNNAWVGFGSATPGSVEAGTQVSALQVQGSYLLVAGAFSQYLVRQDATGLRSAAAGALPTVNYGAITGIFANNADIYIAGNFRFTDNTSPGVMHWDGVAWHPMTDSGGYGARSLAIFDSSLYCSGNQLGTVLRWDGAAWQPVFGPQAFVSCGYSNAAILGVFQDKLVLGGGFCAVQDSTQANPSVQAMVSLAQMSSDGRLGPISRGLGGRVASLSEYRGKVIAGGRFTTIGTWVGGFQSPGVPGRLAEIDEDGFWAPFSGGLPDNNIWATAVFNDQFVIGGEPFSVGGVTGALAAAWDGSTWHDMSQGATDVPVRLVAAGGQLWGEFGDPATSFGTLSLGRWTGSAWEMHSSAMGYSGLVSAGVDLFATDEATQRIVQLTPGGVTVLPLPSGQLSLRIIGAYQGRVICLDADHGLYSWDGQTWTGRGRYPGVTFPATQYMGLPVEVNGFMVVGANPLSSPSNGYETVSGWDGQTWAGLTAMGFYNGASSVFSFSIRPPSLLRLSESEIMVGGAFVGSVRTTNPLADGEAANAARFSFEGRAVTVASPPALTRRNMGQDLQLTWTLSPSLPGTQYQWRHGNGVIMDTYNPNVGWTSGSITNTLTIRELGPSAEGGYSCTATTPCGVYTLAEVYVSVSPTCDLDLNADGVVDSGDIDYLINVIAGGDNPENVDPDFNHDGVSDQTDVDALINAVAGGGCP